MKKYQLFLMTILLCLLVFSGTALADDIKDDVRALAEAESLNEQLALLDKIASENATELEYYGWDYDLTYRLAPGLPDGIIPADWDTLKYTEADRLPENMFGHKFIAICCPGSGEDPRFAGDLLARFPADMRASSLEEAEYALLIRWYNIESGSRNYLDYEAFAVNINTGDAVCFWINRIYVKEIVDPDLLDGDELSQRTLWSYLRFYIWNALDEYLYKMDNGTVLTYKVFGERCSLIDVQFSYNIKELILPDKIDGYPVTEIGYNCFCGKTTLRSIQLPSGLISIGKLAFIGAEKLESINIPSSVRVIESQVFFGCERLSKVVVNEGVKNIDARELFRDCNNMLYLYLPESLTGSRLSSALINKNTVIYAPEGSYAHEWAEGNGYKYVACENPEDMPDVKYESKGDFEYKLFGGEAVVFSYLGKDRKIEIPSFYKDYPVTSVYSLDLRSEEKGVGISVKLPKSVKFVSHNFIANGKVDVYITNPDTIFEDGAIHPWSTQSIITVHAPEGSTAQKYVEEQNDGSLVFEPWEEEVNTDAAALYEAHLISDASAVTEAHTLSYALKMAEKVQQNVAELLKTSDAKEYLWLSRVPGYDIAAPSAAAVLKINQQQFDELALLLGGKDNVATGFANNVNIQYNLPYAKASAKTAESAKLSPSADNKCAIALLAYETDIVLAVIQADGSAQASLICSGPKIIELLSTEYIQKIAAQYGIIGGECSVFKGEELSNILNK